MAQAARYVQSLLPEKLTGDITIDFRFVPSTQLGGDMFGYNWIDDEHFAIYLLDVSGHGVGSSLLAVSAMNMLSAHSLADTDFRDPGQVLSRLNDVFQMEKQNGKYFTIWYGVFEPATRKLAYSNAGHPPALLYTGETAEAASVKELEADGLAIGMVEGMPYDTIEVQLGPYSRLLIYSDGAYEIQKTDGEMWKHSEFVEFVSGLPTAPGPVADRLLAHVQELGSSQVLDDDFSFVEARL